MTNEERDLITRYIQRVGGAPAGGGAFGQGMPAVPPPALAPIDPEADQLIAELFTRYPEARYRITQTAYVHEHALIEAQNRIQRLEWELQQAQQAAQQAAQAAPAPAASPWGQPAQPPRSLFGSLFGAGRQAPPPPPQYQQGTQQQGYGPPPPQYPPGYNPGMLAPRGSGFFGSALNTAAGVAGGVLAANALTSLFSDHHGFGGSFGAPMGGGFAPAPTANPWGAPGGASPSSDPLDAGGAPKDEPDSSGWTDANPNDWQQEPAPDQGGGQPDPGQPDDSGWTDPGSDSGSDLPDPGSGGGDDWTT